MHGDTNLFWDFTGHSLWETAFCPKNTQPRTSLQMSGRSSFVNIKVSMLHFSQRNPFTLIRTAIIPYLLRQNMPGNNTNTLRTIYTTDCTAYNCVIQMVKFTHTAYHHPRLNTLCAILAILIILTPILILTHSVIHAHYLTALKTTSKGVTMITL